MTANDDWKNRATCCSILLSATSSHISFASTAKLAQEFRIKIHYNLNCTHDDTGTVTVMPRNSLWSRIAANLDRDRKKKKQSRMMATAFRTRWLRRIITWIRRTHNDIHVAAKHREREKEREVRVQKRMERGKLKWEKMRWWQYQRLLCCFLLFVGGPHVLHVMLSQPTSPSMNGFYILINSNGRRASWEMMKEFIQRNGMMRFVGVCVCVWAVGWEMSLADAQKNIVQWTAIINRIESIGGTRFIYFIETKIHFSKRFNRNQQRENFDSNHGWQLWRWTFVQINLNVIWQSIKWQPDARNFRKLINI